MSTFIPKTPNGADTIVANNGFFPDLSVNDFRDSYRVDKNISDTRCEETLRHAMLQSNDLLKTWKAVQVAAGYAALADVPGESYGDMSEYQYWYLIAVRQLAKSMLIEKERDFDARNLSPDKVEALNKQIDDCIHHHRGAIEKITGEPSGYRVSLL